MAILVGLFLTELEVQATLYNCTALSQSFVQQQHWDCDFILSFPQHFELEPLLQKSLLEVEPVMIAAQCLV